MPYAPLAQLVEQLIYTEKVGGSSPSGRTVMVHFIASLFNVLGEYIMKFVKYLFDEEEPAAPKPPAAPVQPRPWTEKRRDGKL
jgi:hypothetical protein